MVDTKSKDLSIHDLMVLERHRRYLDRNPDLREFIERRETEYKKVKLENITDPLTGVCNRRYFDEAIKKDFELADQDTPLSLVMIDIDKFKRINDSISHIEGDKVLRKVSDTIRGGLRETDIVCRYGGEEFAVILPVTDLKDAAMVTERIRETVYKPKIDENHDIGISISCGIARYPDDRIHSSEDLVSYADTALRLAKENGRNRTELYKPV
jgi:diguanylate cyclase (GGDEF)-like protein